MHYSGLYPAVQGSIDSRRILYEQSRCQICFIEIVCLDGEDAGGGLIHATTVKAMATTRRESSNSANKPREGTSSDSPQGSHEMATTDTNVATAVKTSRTPLFASDELLASDPEVQAWCESPVNMDTSLAIPTSSNFGNLGNTPIQPRSGNPQTTSAPSTSPQHLPVGPDIQATNESSRIIDTTTLTSAFSSSCDITGKQSLLPRSGTPPTIPFPQQSVELPSTSRAQPTPPNPPPPRQPPKGQHLINRSPQRSARGPAQAEWLQRRTPDDYWHYLMDMHPWARLVKPQPLRREDLTEAQISNFLQENTYRQVPHLGCMSSSFVRSLFPRVPPDMKQVSTTLPFIEFSTLEDAIIFRDKS
ncbi:unnamed protein product [Cylicocyclus nassatus]|uniref:Uncharacterized protein n=1 Tax=Cylicocyclus nassatus TaxID=53992 RepID=A0AA36M885_CYLNA|nr:unnamed protein product [Cylicocyclus nassatus]